jgi:hypothetical protein
MRILEAVDNALENTSGLITLIGVEVVGLAAVITRESLIGKIGGGVLMAAGAAIGAKEHGNSQAVE